jgi:hypothetical protein
MGLQRRGPGGARGARGGGVRPDGRDVHRDTADVSERGARDRGSARASSLRHAVLGRGSDPGSGWDLASAGSYAFQGSRGSSTRPAARAADRVGPAARVRPGAGGAARGGAADARDHPEGPAVGVLDVDGGEDRAARDAASVPERGRRRARGEGGGLDLQHDGADAHASADGGGARARVLNQAGDRRPVVLRQRPEASRVR